LNIYHPVKLPLFLSTIYLFILFMNSNKNLPRQVERIATLAAKAAQIAATRIALTDCDEAILDVIEAALITQEAQELAKELIEIEKVELNTTDAQPTWILD